MKKLLLIAFSLLLAINCGFSQTPDYQWLISNSNGKNGTITPPIPAINNYVTSVTIGNQFNLNGVSSPISGLTPAHKNDLFIIYSDGNHYNSRYSPDAGVFFNGIAGPTVWSHNFETPSSTAVRYLYLSKRYEGDELPTGVRVSSGPVSGAYSLGTTSSSLLSSSHNVVIGRDITLIINNQQLLDKTHGDTEGVYTLEFDGLRPAGSSTIYTVDFMDLMPVFMIGSSPSAVYTNYQIESGTNSIVLHPTTNAPYEYVNLRNNSRALAYGPTGDSPNFYAVFTIKHNGVAVVPSHEQAILNSYDPNFLQVLSISEESDHYIVKYHLEFENTSSSVAANTLKVKIIFPPGFQLPHHIEWFAKHVNWGGHMDPMTGVPNGYEFTFNPNASIIHTVGDPNSGSAFIEFKVKVTGIDVANASNSLRLGTPTVQFDSNDPYPVVEFRDLINCIPENSRLNCTRPVAMAKSKCLDLLCWVFLFAAIVITIAVIVGLLILLRLSRNSRTRPRP